MLKFKITKRLIRTLILLVTLFCVSTDLISQTQFDIINAASPDAGFKDVADKVDEYFKENPNVKGIKQWERWKWYAERHLDVDGKVGNVTKRNMQALQKLNISATSFGPVDSDPDPTAKINGDWTPIGPFNIASPAENFLGRVNCVAFHPSIANTIYAGTPGGGLWRSTSNGGSWAPLTDGLPSSGISGIVIHPTTPNIMYILTGDGNGGVQWGYYVKEQGCGVYKSTDGGQTWATTGLNWEQSDIKYGYKLIMHPSNPNILLAATSDGIYRTLNGGTSWTQEISGNFPDIEFKANDPTMLCATRFNVASLYVSENTGDTWTAKTIPGGAITRGEIAVTPANSGLAYLMLGPQTSGSYRGFYSYNWSTEAFTLIDNTNNVFTGDPAGAGNGGFPWWCIGLWVSPTSTSNMLMGGVIGRRSTNGGATWFADNEDMHADNHGFFFNPLNNQVFAVNDGGVFRSSDNGDTWTNITGIMQITQYYRMSGVDANANILLGGTQDNGHHLRTTNTTIYNHVITCCDGMDNGINYDNTDIMYGFTQNGGLNKSTNGGVSFTGIKPSIASGSEPWVVPFLVHTTNPSTIFYASENGLLRHTADGQPTSAWTNLGGSGSTGAFAMGTSNINRGYLASSGATFRRTDDLASASPTWTVKSGTTGWPSTTGTIITSIDVNPTNSLEVWVTFSGYNAVTKVLRSTNGGDTWVNETDNLPNIPVHIVKFRPGAAAGGAVYIGTDIGVFYRDNDIGQWLQYGNRLPRTIVTDLEISTTSNVITASTYGRGFWRSPLYNAACDLNLSLTSFMTGEQYQQASSTISVTGDIIGGAGTKILLKAGGYVNFNDGFEVKAGNEMRAFIGPCASDNPAFLQIPAGTIKKNPPKNNQKK